MPTTRRQALKTLAAAAIATSLARVSVLAETPTTPAPSDAAKPPAPSGPFTLPALPYSYEALEPHIDAMTMHLHHDKHHASYVAKLNEAVAKEPSVLGDSGPDLDKLLRGIATVPESIRTAVRNNGGGHANHSLFWQTLSPKGGGEPKGELAQAITKDLGGFDKFRQDAAKLAGNLFGSGWVWLFIDDRRKLGLTALPNQDTPLMFSKYPYSGQYPLFGIDVWEHAYYLRYHNVRADYVSALWNVVNWDFIADRYTAALKMR